MSVEVISLAEKHSQFKDAWAPRRVAKLDNYEIKLAKAEGAFDWHAHLEEDEFFSAPRGGTLFFDPLEPILDPSWTPLGPLLGSS